MDLNMVLMILKNEYDFLYRNNRVNGKKLQNYKLIHN